MLWFTVQVLLAIVATVNSLGFHGFHFKGLEEPAWVGPRIISEKWIEQPVDHFDHRNNRNWQMRYYEEDKYFNGTGPIFITLGGEWAIGPGSLQSGLMADLGRKHGALMFYTEHRYYGKSEPTQNLTVENIQYLNVDQALADVAYFIDNKKAERNVTNAKVIVFGGSYAGNMAAWIRIKYPHLVQGALASSAPVYAKADFYEYYEVVTNSLRRYDPQCAADVEEAIDQAEELLAKDPQKLKELFNLCDELDINDNKEVGFFMSWLAEIFAGVVQYNNDYNGRSDIGEICKKMMNAANDGAAPIQRLAKISRKSSNCIKLSYDSFVSSLQNSNWGSSIMRQWTFQTCTEFGYYQTANSSKSAFGGLFRLDFFVNLCSDIYGKYYDGGLLDWGIDRTNKFYGGRLPDVTNVIFSNGDIDPWHALSVLSDLNESSPAILINGSSHCQDLQADRPGDLPALTEARKRIRNVVSSWVQN